jgi:hypothetical protein
MNKTISVASIIIAIAALFLSATLLPAPNIAFGAAAAAAGDGGVVDLLLR